MTKTSDPLRPVFVGIDVAKLKNEFAVAEAGLLPRYIVIYRAQIRKDDDIDMNDQVPPEIVEILDRLIKDNEILGHKVTALTFVCAHLLKERCIASSTPLATLARMEGELGGTAEAIALRLAADSSASTSGTREFSRLIDSMLFQTNDAVKRSVVREQQSKGL